jgi:itaconyl-CoA hydratase
MDAPDFSEFQLWPHGHKYEDFDVNATFDHHWGRTINAGDASLFSSVALRYCPLYVNAEYARAEGHKDVVVDPMLVLATVIGLSVEDLSEAGGPFLGVNNVVFHEPVYPGDTITASSVVLEKRASGSRPDSGIVTWRTTAKNQRADVVVQYERTNLVARRGD